MPPRIWLIVMLALLTIGLGQIVGAYGYYSQTWDEPAHLAAGIELLTRGTYTYEAQHPPLSRIALSLGPYLDGMRSIGRPGIWNEGEALFAAAADYQRTLTLARFGILPFFALALVATWWWARRIANNVTAIVAVLMLATLPPLLGNAGLATTDMASVATLTLAFLALGLWLDRPLMARALLLGASAGLTVVTKFSAIPFLGLVAISWLSIRWLVSRPPDGSRRPTVSIHWGQIAVMSLVFVFVLWAVYGFGLTPGYPAFIDSILAGIQSVSAHNAKGHTSFLLGEVRQFGWWYYYLVELAVRTPIPLLLMGLPGLAWLAVAGWRARDWSLLAAPTAFIVILGFVSLYSRINIGLRHIMVLYPMMAIGAGYLVWRLWNRALPTRIVLAGMLLWQIGISAVSFPDNLTYFNMLAGDKPERILIDGDLDWGQDLQRLADAVRERKIKTIALAYNGSASPSRFLPGYRLLPPNTPSTGWLAISLFKRVTVNYSCGGFRWLDAYQPVARIGRSIDLYHIKALKPRTLSDKVGVRPCR